MRNTVDVLRESCGVLIGLVGFYILIMVFFVVWVGFCLFGLVLFLMRGVRRLEVGELESAGNVFGKVKLKR